MDVQSLKPHERQQRQNIRNLFLTATVEQLTKERDYRKARKDQVGVDSLQEMIDECEEHGVNNYGEVPMIW